MRRLPLALALLVFASAATAQVYKWTDHQGMIHYTQMPPAQGVKYTKIKAAGGQPASAGGAPSQGSAPAAAPSAPAEASTAPVRDTPENRATMCASLQANLSTLRSSGPVVMQQGGQPQLLDGAEREKQLAEAQDRYQQYCPH